MTLTFKYANNEATYTMKCGEVAQLMCDPNGFWGLETNKGYNEWEGVEMTTKRADAVKRMREYDRRNMEQSKYATA
jgi:hypothetical protein